MPLALQMPLSGKPIKSGFNGRRHRTIYRRRRSRDSNSIEQLW